MGLGWGQGVGWMSPQGEHDRCAIREPDERMVVDRDAIRDLVARSRTDEHGFVRVGSEVSTQSHACLMDDFHFIAGRTGSRAETDTPRRWWGLRRRKFRRSCQANVCRTQSVSRALQHGQNSSLDRAHPNLNLSHSLVAR
eukprot:3743468-Rhodomonas_salina.2